MDIILYNIGAVIIVLLTSYLIGSISNSILISKIFFHKDPREFGSGNPGGTNTGRMLGKKIGFLVIVLDSLKIIAPMYIFWLILTKAPIYYGVPLMNTVQQIYIEGVNDAVIKWPVYWLTTVGISIGHCFPIYYHFKGGKNVSTVTGIAIGTSWLYLTFGLPLYLLILKIKKYVSLASIIIGWVMVACFWGWAVLITTKTIPNEFLFFINYGPSLDCGYTSAICYTFCVSLMTIRHKENIIRLMNGTERKIKWMDGKKSKNQKPQTSEDNNNAESVE